MCFSSNVAAKIGAHSESSILRFRALNAMEITFKFIINRALIQIIESPQWQESWVCGRVQFAGTRKYPGGTLRKSGQCHRHIVKIYLDTNHGEVVVPELNPTTYRYLF